VLQALREAGYIADKLFTSANYYIKSSVHSVVSNYSRFTATRVLILNQTNITEEKAGPWKARKKQETKTRISETLPSLRLSFPIF